MADDRRLVSPILARRARQLRRRLNPRTGLARAYRSTPAILQIVVAVVVAYLFAHFVLGHPFPTLALTVTISSLGFGRDARPRRVAETALGMILGIALSETVLQIWGTGVWQIIVILVATLFIARAISPVASFAVAAGVQSMLVIVSAAPPGSVYSRSIDAVVGGCAALLFTALIPRNPTRVARRDAKRLFVELSSAFTSLVSALRSADVDAADRTLGRLRKTQPVIDDWASSIDSAIGVATISPFLRRHRDGLIRQRRILHAMDLATRGLRVVTRRIDILIRDGVPRPELAELVASIASAVNLLGQSLTEPALENTARRDLRLIAASLDPQRIVPDLPDGRGRIADKTVVVNLRPLVVDLLGATGMSVEEARTVLPAL